MLGTYTEIESRIQRALAAIQASGEKPNLTQYASDFAVLYDRLRRRYKGKASKSTRPRTNQRLNQDQIAALKTYIQRCDSLRASALYFQIHHAAERILKLSDPLELPLRKHWVTEFLRLNSDCHLVKQKSKDIQRTAAQESVVFKDYFTKYQRLKDELGIMDQDIYNFDETGFRISVGGNQ